MSVAGQQRALNMSQTYTLRELLLRKTFPMPRTADAEPFAVPVHGVHQKLIVGLYSITNVAKNLSLVVAKSPCFSQLVSLQIAANKLCLHRLLFVENFSLEKERPDCFPAFYTDHAQRELSITIMLGGILLNVDLVSRIQDQATQHFLRESTLEIVYQLIAPFHEACNSQNELGENSSLIAKLYQLLSRMRRPFQHSNVLEQSPLRNTPPLDAIRPLLSQLCTLSFASPRAHLGLLKFWGLVRTQAVQGTLIAKSLAVHEDLLYDALHMQLPIALLPADTFERVYDDIQLSPSRAYPFKACIDNTFPWYSNFSKNCRKSPAGTIGVSSASIPNKDSSNTVCPLEEELPRRQEIELVNVVGSTGDLSKREFRGVLLTPDDIGRPPVHATKFLGDPIEGQEVEDLHSSITSSLESLEANRASDGNALWIQQGVPLFTPGARMFEQPQVSNNSDIERTQGEHQQ